MSAGGRLAGQVVVNTRPAHQQADLTAMLEAEGATVLPFPAIEIELVADAAARELADRIADFDILLFVSRNAVDGAFALLDPAALGVAQRFGVIGAATRAALAERIGRRGERLIESEPYNSEALLEADALQQVGGRRIAIFRGQAGRNLLGDELARRGATVEYAEVYRRARPRVNDDAFAVLAAGASPTVVVLTSGEGMRNLMAIVDATARTRLCALPWLLISERMRESARELGHNAPIIIAHSASDRGIAESLCAWAEQQKNA